VTSLALVMASSRLDGGGQVPAGPYLPKSDAVRVLRPWRCSLEGDGWVGIGRLLRAYHPPTDCWKLESSDQREAGLRFALVAAGRLLLWLLAATPDWCSLRLRRGGDVAMGSQRRGWADRDAGESLILEANSVPRNQLMPLHREDRSGESGCREAKRR